MLKTISIIDDDVQITNFLGVLAKKWGYNTQEYSDVTTFLKQEHYKHELIILDLCMPHVDGVELIRSLAKNNCQSSLILMSGQDQSVLKSAQSLCHEYHLECLETFTKPINTKKLRKLIGDFESDNEASGGGGELWKPNKKDLELALANKDLILHFQPQIHMKTGKIDSVEALVRWQHPEHGLIFPDQFIDLAEKENLIEVLTEQVIEMAIVTSQDWIQHGLNLKMSVNVSAKNISSLSLPEYLSHLLVSNQLETSLITLEVTESQLMGELSTSLDILTRLRLKGFPLSIDDFGTGYSSLSLLHKIPFSELKIDKSFVMNITSDKGALAIVETCVMLSHKLGMTCVAEGVETKEHLSLLENMGCDVAQGYYIARPMAADNMLSWMGQQSELMHG